MGIAGHRSAARREIVLLAVAAGFVLAAAAAVAIIPFARLNMWAAGVGLWDFPRLLALPAAWLASAFAAHVILRRALAHRDPYLLPIVFLLSGWGLALIWRLAPGFGFRQALWLCVATAAMLATALLPGDLRWLRRYRYTWLIAGLALTALTFLFGVNPSGIGDRLWLGAFGLFLQPAEVLKLLLVIFLAAYLADRREPLFATRPTSQQRSTRLAYALPMLVMWGFSMLILFLQRDLGMSALFFVTFLIMLYLASGSGWYVLAGGALLLVGVIGGYALFDVVRVRVDGWWDPWADPSGRSFQIVQSLIAVAAGGLLGRGPGLGAPTLIPVAHSDFVFAALAEEWGVLGALGALGLLAALVARGLRIAANAQSVFRQLLAAGLTALLAVQAIIIAGGVLKLIPLTGLTLPFLSYGGSSLVTNFILAGLLLRISAEPRRGSA